MTLEKHSPIGRHYRGYKYFDEIIFKNDLRKKHLCQSLFFIKVASPRPLLKRTLWHKCFRVNFAKFLRTLFLQNTFGRLLLQILAVRNHLKIFSFKVRNINTPLRKKFPRVNNAPNMTQTYYGKLSWEYIWGMCRSQLETKCLKNKTHTGLKLYKKQKNFCFKLRKKRQKI